MTYSPPKRSTIGAGGLNFRVRNEIGCTPTAESPTHNTQLFYFEDPIMNFAARHMG
jgi:hypothetical protein